MEFCVVKLTPKKQIVLKSADLSETVKYISDTNSNATYLDNVELNTFLADNTYELGFYILCDILLDKYVVYSVENVVSLGYFYNSEYKQKRLVNEYELIENKL